MPTKEAFPFQERAEGLIFTLVKKPFLTVPVKGESRSCLAGDLLVVGPVIYNPKMPFSLPVFCPHSIGKWKGIYRRKGEPATWVKCKVLFGLILNQMREFRVDV